jgi:hypothetical protein
MRLRSRRNSIILGRLHGIYAARNKWNETKSDGCVGVGAIQTEAARACMHAWSRLPRGSNNGRWAGPACRPGRFDFDQTIIVVVTEQMCYRQLQTHARVARSRCCSIILYYSNFGTCRVACLTTTVYHSTCGFIRAALVSLSANPGCFDTFLFSSFLLLVLLLLFRQRILL